MTSKTALVTGATGFLGKHLCQQLSQQGWLVYALCRNQKKAKELDNSVQIINGDILAPEGFTQQIPKNLDAIFHTAASTNTWFKNNKLQTLTNLTGTQNIIDLAMRYQAIKLIHISSVVVYGLHAKIKNIVEDMTKSGAQSSINYVKTKTASEKLVLNTKGLNAVIINPTHIIGPGDKHNWARLIKMIAENKLPSIPNGSGSFVDVRDVAAGIINAFHYGEPGENYLLGGTDMNFKQFVICVANKLNVQATKVQLPNFLLKVLAHVKNIASYFSQKEPDITPESVALISDVYACNSSKARTQIKYTTRDFESTISTTLSYLKSEKIIP